MKKYLILLLVGAILILLAGATYYAVVQLLAKQLSESELEKVELVKQEKQDDEEKLNTCLEEARIKHEERWDSACKRLGRETREDERCGLPSEQAKHYDNEYKNLRGECLDRFK